MPLVMNSTSVGGGGGGAGAGASGEQNGITELLTLIFRYRLPDR